MKTMPLLLAVLLSTPGFAKEVPELSCDFVQPAPPCYRIEGSAVNCYNRVFRAAAGKKLSVDKYQNNPYKVLPPTEFALKFDGPNDIVGSTFNGNESISLSSTGTGSYDGFWSVSGKYNADFFVACYVGAAEDGKPFPSSENTVRENSSIDLSRVAEGTTGRYFLGVGCGGASPRPGCDDFSYLEFSVYAYLPGGDGSVYTLEILDSINRVDTPVFRCDLVGSSGARSCANFDQVEIVGSNAYITIRAKAFRTIRIIRNKQLYRGVNLDFMYAS